MIFLDSPRFVPPTAYEQAIDKVVGRLSSRSDVSAVYQLGSTSSPGISDIDLLVVLNTEPPERTDPFVDLDDDQRYLFTHDLFGIPEAEFRKFICFTMYHNYRFLSGVELDTNSPVLEPEDQRVLREQVAMEFLLSNFIARTIELTYGLASIRGLLLSGHALRYDLDFLGITSGPLHEVVAQLDCWRRDWFEEGRVPRLTASWLGHLRNTICELLQELMQGGAMYLPCGSSAPLARHISLWKADTLGVERKGVSIPQVSRLFGMKAKKIMNRINHFRFRVPYRSDPRHSILGERFYFLRHLMSLKMAGRVAFQVPTSNLTHMILKNMETTATAPNASIRNGDEDPEVREVELVTLGVGQTIRH